MWYPSGLCSWIFAISYILTLLCPVCFKHFHAKTTGLHVALHECNSGVESGRELLKGLKDLASLVVCN